MWRDMERICAAAGLPMVRPDPFRKNSLLGRPHRPGRHDEGWGVEFSKAVYQAEFARGEQIGDPATIQTVLDGLNLPAEDILERAAAPANKDRLKRATADAHGRGIFGAPSFVTPDGELFWAMTGWKKHFPGRLQTANRAGCNAAKSASHCRNLIRHCKRTLQGCAFKEARTHEIHQIATILVALFAFVLGGAPASAVECKGLTKSRCGGSSSCTWVSGYKRQDGAEVKSYCRASSGQAAKTSTKKSTQKEKIVGRIQNRLT